MGKKILLFAAIFLMAGAVYAQVTVTINLDMSQTDYNETVEDLFFSGELNGWTTPGEDPNYQFTDNGDGTFKLILPGIDTGYYACDFYRVPQGTIVWPDLEWAGAPTGVDIMVYVGNQDVDVNIVWGEAHTLTFNVNMNGVAGFNPVAHSVYFINSFIAYNQTVLTDANSDGIYTVTLSGRDGKVVQGLPQGNIYAIFGYGFVDDMTLEWKDTITTLANRLITITNKDLTLNYKFGNSIGVGISHVSAPGFSLYPNPSNGIFSVNKSCSLEVFNITGKSILKQPAVMNKSIDISDQPAGIYFVKMASGTNISTQKLIIK